VNTSHRLCLSIGIALDIFVSIIGLKIKQEITYKGNGYDAYVFCS